MILRTWCGSRVDTRDRGCRIYFLVALGWLRRFGWPL